MKSYESKYYIPDPTWLTFFALAIGIALFAGTYKGLSVYRQFTEPYLSLQSMKVTGMGENDGFDVNKGGEAIMDAGIVRFSPTTSVDLERTSHFMYKTLYCVAPLVDGGTAPQSQSYDIWVVGKNCCATGASDYRCGLWQDNGALFGTRVTADEDLAYYRLAVQQAESVFGMMARHPIFFTQSTDPFGAGYSSGFGGVGGSGGKHGGKSGGTGHQTGDNSGESGGLAALNRESQRQYLFFCAFMFVFFLFAVTCATAKFSFMGRNKNMYPGFDTSDPTWRNNSGIDTHVRRPGMMPPHA